MGHTRRLKKSFCSQTAQPAAKALFAISFTAACLERGSDVGFILLGDLAGGFFIAVLTLHCIEDIGLKAAEGKVPRPSLDNSRFEGNRFGSP